MKDISIKAYAKINLTLDVVGKRADGYHDLETIMQSVDLWDRIILKEIDEGIELESNIQGFPHGKANIAWRAARLIKDEFKISKGIHIYIDKNIPMEAGLAGGSADCAGVLTGLNRLWDLGMDGEKLRTLGKNLGADVPFCLMGGTALGQGIGDILAPIDAKEELWLVIVRPDFGVSTKEIFSRLRIGDIGRRPDNQMVIGHLEAGRVQDVAENLVNVLEEVTIPMHPEIAQIKSQLIGQGALGSLMSGSGPSVYGIFGDRDSAHAAAKSMKDQYGQVFALKTLRSALS